MTDSDSPKLTRQTGEGFDIFREPQSQDSKPGRAYIKHAVDLHLVIDRYRLMAATLSANDAKAPRAHSLANFGPEIWEQLGISSPPTEPETTRDVNHIDRWLSAPLNMNPGMKLGLISSMGTARYEGEIGLYLHIGSEDHSHVWHAISGSTFRKDESVFFSVYVSRERMEWLHRELISRPNAHLLMRGTIYAFEVHSDWPGQYSSPPRFFIEPEKVARLDSVSFELRDPDFSVPTPERDSSQSAQLLVSDAVENEREKWVSEFNSSLKLESEPWQHRCSNALYYMSHRAAESCVKRGETAGRMRDRLNRAEIFMRTLDAALHEEGGPFADEKGAVWQHLNFQSFVKNTTRSQREEFVALYNFSESLDEYIASPNLQNDYLDWLMLDVMTAQNTVALMEAFMTQKHGLAYAFFGASQWKLLLWKLTVRPLGFVFGWVLPAVAFYFLALWSLWIGLGLATIYYGFSVLMLARWIWYKLISIVAGTPSRRLLKQIEEIDRIYPLLGSPVMHVGAVRTAFERASDRGVIWDQRIFYILDHLTKRNPQPWRIRLPR